MASSKRGGAKDKAAMSARPARMSRQTAMVALVFALVAAVMSSTLTVPSFLESRRSAEQLAETRAQSEQLLGRLQAAEGGGDAQLELLYGRVQLLEEFLPASPSREELAVLVVQLAEATGVQVQRLDPSADAAQEGRFVFNTRFAGPYAALLTFMDRLERSAGLVTFGNVELSTQGELYLLSSSLTFWFTPGQRLTEPIPQADSVPLDPGVFEAPEPQLDAPQAQDGQAQDGQAQDGQAQDGQAQDGQAQPGVSAQP